MEHGAIGESREGPSTALVAIEEHRNPSEISGTHQTAFPALDVDAGEDSSDTEDMDVSKISDEDVQLLIEPSISRVASRLKSPKTPALEKAAAMEELDGGGFFESDFETPPADVESPSDEVLEFSPGEAQDAQAELNGGTSVTNATTRRLSGEKTPSDPNAGLSLGPLPSPKVVDPEIPITPWHVDAKPFVVQKTGSSMQGVFTTGRTRSLSGGAEALRKLLPKGLSSMAQMGNIFTSSNTHQKSKLGTSPTRDSNYFRPTRSGSSSSPTTPRQNSSMQGFESIISTRPQTLSRQATGTNRPKNIRRVTSDDSLLYHSLSRASSLGDDARFENHREQVNSRVKAIRDSLQDRSSFRMPQMPNMPSMPRVPSFGFSMNFLNNLNANTVPARSRSNTDLGPDILPVTNKRQPSSIPNPAVGPGMVATTFSTPAAAVDAAGPLTEGTNPTSLDRAMEHLTGDIVIMGGYRGSILRSTKTNRQVWVPVKVGLNIRKVDLEVGLEPEDEERMPETIYPSGMLQNIGPVDISKRLFKRLGDCENARNGKLRVWDYGYDWRLSPHLLARQLTEFLEKLPSNQARKDSSRPGATVIAHSLGGLITRHVVNHRPELFAGVVYAGVPQACVNILGPLRNGDAVLLSQRVLTAQVNFTLRTSFVLLPEDGGCFIDINTKEKYPVDFFNLDDWIKYRWSPCTDPPLPPWSPPSGGLGSLLTMPGSLLSLPIPGKKSNSGTSSPQISGSLTGEASKERDGSPSKTSRVADTLREAENGTDRTIAPQMAGNTNPVSRGQNTNSSISTAVTIPRDKAITYLRRTLAETKKFKQELHFKPEISKTNRYPPLAVIYGKSIPTCAGAKVNGRDSIPCSDVYDNLAFASGDGVCLAKEAMLPTGYKTVYGGRISSDRGHVTLLGDLNAIGRALEAVAKGRAKGIGLGI